MTFQCSAPSLTMKAIKEKFNYNIYTYKNCKNIHYIQTCFE